MHPTEPFSGYLGTIIVHVHMVSEFYPTIAAIEIVGIFVILVAVFVGANQGTDFQIIISKTQWK